MGCGGGDTRAVVAGRIGAWVEGHTPLGCHALAPLRQAKLETVMHGGDALWQHSSVHIEVPSTPSCEHTRCAPEHQLFANAHLLNNDMIFLRCVEQ